MPAPQQQHRSNMKPVARLTAGGINPAQPLLCPSSAIVQNAGPGQTHDHGEVTHAKQATAVKKASHKTLSNHDDNFRDTNAEQLWSQKQAYSQPQEHTPTPKQRTTIAHRWWLPGLIVTSKPVPTWQENPFLTAATV